MIFTKIGKIFDPRDHVLPSGCVEFAQSPQALVLEDRIRIFFSTRQKDQKKFLSHIAFVDFDMELKNVMSVSSNPVLPLGALGCYDEHGIFPLNVLRDDDVIRGYICGWSRRVSVSVETAIGLAFSEDEGKTFTRYGSGPIMTADVNEPFLVGDPFVLKIERKYHMWYIFGTKWVTRPTEIEPQRVYKIGHASSNDGVTWVRSGRQLVENVIDEDECQALPTVIFAGSSYHMFFCYRHAYGFRTEKGRGYCLGHAVSRDLEIWSRCADPLPLGDTVDSWDSEMMCYPHVFSLRGKIYLLYNGNAFGRFGFGAALIEEVNT